MKVTTVSVSIRYSKSLAPGEHKTLELSAEGGVSEDDDWFTCQQGLYSQLTTQLRRLWAQNGVIQEPAPDGPRMAVAGSSDWEDIESQSLPSPSVSSPKVHYCQEHQTPFKKCEKGGSAWYSHKMAGGWCREPGRQGVRDG
jgi:hypothetical protein